NLASTGPCAPLHAVAWPLPPSAVSEPVPQTVDAPTPESLPMTGASDDAEDPIVPEDMLVGEQLVVAEQLFVFEQQLVAEQPPVTNRVIWPQLQSPAVEASFKIAKPVVIAASESVVVRAPEPVVERRLEPPEPPRPPAPDWVELIESLRRDIERLRLERAQPLP